MALSGKSQAVLGQGIADLGSAAEICIAINANTTAATANTARVSANIAALGTTTDLVGVDGTASNAAPLVGTETRLDAIEAKVDALIAALVAAGLMTAP